MKQELQEKLFNKYPDLFKEKDLPPTQTCMCWGIDCDDGWYDLIDQLCNELEKLKKQHKDLKIVFGQVKEKFGGLRVYYGCTWEYDDMVYEIITRFERQSYKVCEKCGKLGKPNARGWIKTLCEICREGEHKNVM